MRVFTCVVLVGLGSLFASGQANAQHGSYGGHGYGYGHGSHYSNRDIHHVAPAQHRVQAYGAGLPSYGYGNSLPIGGFGGLGSYPQYAAPPISSYHSNYSNHYYGRPSHSHHTWHPGHYLFGHH